MCQENKFHRKKREPNLTPKKEREREPNNPPKLIKHQRQAYPFSNNKKKIKTPRKETGHQATNAQATLLTPKQSRDKNTTG